ncbi:MAG: phasin [Mesorhizobium sp.]|nr:phasin [Mesorhizobium sp.]MCO5160361.1 phasin [Mesorhizobium sp.]
MSKTAKDTIEFPSFDASKATEQLRDFTEKGIEQTKEVYSKLKSGAEDAQKTFESTYETARATGAELSLKTISAMRANADAAFSHLEALVGVKSVSEFIELQTAWMRKSVEMGVEQAKDLQAASTKAVEDVAKPVKTAFEKTMKELKVA